MAALAREIACDILRDAALKKPRRLSTAELCELGGLDVAACEAAGLAHDFGHPPFGHTADSELNRWLGDSEGFEGNPQTIRVVTRLDRKSQHYGGLNLSAVTIAALTKYPWLRATDPADQHHRKWNVYTEDADALAFGRQAVPDAFGAEQQSLEASIMDVADDITYALHDLQDFYQANLLDVQAIRADMKAGAEEVFKSDGASTTFATRATDLEAYYPGYFDRHAYSDALDEAEGWLGSTLAYTFDDSPAAVARLRNQFSRYLKDALGGIQVAADPPWENGPRVFLESSQWHLIQVLKTIAKSYVVETPMVGLHQRAQRKHSDRLVSCGVSVLAPGL